MKDRIRKIERIRQVQQHMHRVAELRMSGLENSRRINQSEQLDLISALNEDSSFQGLFVDATARRLKSLAHQGDQIATECLTQRTVVIERGLQLKRTEKTCDRLKEHDRRETEKRELQNILEQIISRSHKLPAS